MMWWINRYRHGRGFGVHSTFAYRLITEVLREDLPYYDWTRVKDRRERLLYRLVCRFRPEAVSAPARLLDVARMASPSVRAAGADTAAFVVVAAGSDPATAAAALRRGAVVMILGSRHRPLVDALLPVLSALGHGMVFDNEGDTALIVTDGRLPFQVFNARF